MKRRGFVERPLLFVLALMFSFSASRAQVMIDVSKITCNQFVTYKITNPEYIAIWLSGYYHPRGDMIVDTQALSADVKKVEDYCLTQPDVLLVQAVKTILGLGR